MNAAYAPAERWCKRCHREEPAVHIPRGRLVCSECWAAEHRLREYFAQPLVSSERAA